MEQRTLLLEGTFFSVDVWLTRLLLINNPIQAYKLACTMYCCFYTFSIVHLYSFVLFLTW